MTSIGLLSVSGLAVLALTVAAIVAMSRRGGAGPLGLDKRCSNAAFSCGVVGGLLISIVPIVVAVLTLLLWRLWSVRRRYARRAEESPAELVETTAAGRVIGRNGLCQVLQQSLQDRDSRRPQLLIGDVGVGKTAVLVRLTKLLALRGAVPVPIRLRDAKSELDFLTLARVRFLTEVEKWLLSEAEGDKIWRKLLEEDRIVVLADGLEEALIDERSRDTTIRLAFAAAHNNRVPLVVTARPHDAMRYADAAVLRLEPLSEGAAVRFIASSRPHSNGALRKIVETAEIVEAPVYMQVTRQLHEHDLLGDVDLNASGRLALRVRLLDRWRNALVKRKLDAPARYSSEERERALGDLASMACAGLVEDTLEVRFDDVAKETLLAADVSDPRDFRCRLAEGCVDLRHAAAVGDRLKIVDAKSASVRFRHSIIQAYLGSLRIGHVLGAESDYLDRLLEKPGREALLALVIFCHRQENATHRGPVRDALLRGPAKRHDAKAVEMLAAAVEIDGMMDADRRDWIENAVRRIWVSSNDEDTQSAKLHAVARLGERTGFAGRRAAAATPRDRDRYSALWRICVAEAGYAVRLAAAQQLASGGSCAFEAVQPMLEKALGAAQEAYEVDAGEWPRTLQRELALQGWILPLLASSVGPEHADEVASIVAAWLGLLGKDGAPLSIEASWAQGFKYEANVRPGRVDPALRTFVRDQAALLAPRTRFWFSRISLLHAFTLWRLAGQGGATREAAQRAVKGWHIDRGHPFVDEAAALCELALVDGRPARHIWIDEAGVMSKLGPTAASVADAGDSMLWISQAAGWLALSDRARRLVGEMVVLLNLADRIDMSAEERLRRVSGDLPGCMTSAGGRGRLRVDGKAPTAEHPSGCHENCRLGLCPYPAPGADLYRGELSDAFCREQLRILGRAGRRAHWQKGQSRDELRKFWADMEARARA